MQNKPTEDPKVQMYSGLILVILGLILTPVLIGIPLLIYGMYQMFAGSWKRND